MPLRPNIQTRGRLLRLLIGLALACVAVTCAFALTGTARWIAALAGAAAAFVLFEAAASWCAARACGLRTPF